MIRILPILLVAFGLFLAATAFAAAQAPARGESLAICAIGEETSEAPLEKKLGRCAKFSSFGLAGVSCQPDKALDTAMGVAAMGPACGAGFASGPAIANSVILPTDIPPPKA